MEKNEKKSFKEDLKGLSQNRRECPDKKIVDYP